MIELDLEDSEAEVELVGKKEKKKLHELELIKQYQDKNGHKETKTQEEHQDGLGVTSSCMNIV